jgi:hypothetical protein
MYWGVDLLNQSVGYFFWICPQKSLDKLVSDFYIYLQIGVGFFKQVLTALYQIVNKNIIIPIGNGNPKKNLSSKKRITYGKQLLV